MLQCRTLAEAWRIYDASGASAVKTDPSFRPRSAKSVCKPAVRSDSFIASLACHNNLLPDVIKTKGRGGYEIADKMNMRRTSYAGEASSRSCLPSGESRSICFCVFLFFLFTSSLLRRIDCIVSIHFRVFGRVHVILRPELCYCPCRNCFLPPPPHSAAVYRPFDWLGNQRVESFLFFMYIIPRIVCRFGVVARR